MNLKKIFLFISMLYMSSVSCVNPLLFAQFGAAVTVSLQELSQLGSVLLAVMQHMSNKQGSLSQQMLLAYEAQAKTITISQQNLPTPDLHLMHLPPLNGSVHQIQTVYQDQLAFMLQVHQKAHTTLEHAQLPTETIDVVHSVVTKPVVTLSDLKSPSITELLTQDIVRKQTVLIEKYHQEIALKFHNENAWTATSMPGSLKYTSPNGNVFVELKTVNQNTQAIYHEAQQKYLHSLREMHLEMLRNPAYKSLIETQVKLAITLMGQLNSNNPHERLFAIENLSKLHINGAPDLYTQKTIHSLLQGFIQADGTIQANALIEKNNYTQEIIKRFIKTINEDLGALMPIREWANSIDLNHIDGANTYPISRGHNMVHAIRDALHLSHNYRALLVNNKLHQARLECLQKAQLYDFASVDHLIKAHNNDLVMQKTQQHFLQEFNQKLAYQQQKVLEYQHALFDKQGFYKACNNNPWFMLLNAQEKQRIAACPEQLELCNKNLLAQLTIKNELMERWNIPQDAPAHIHQMVYLCMGKQAQNLSAPIVMIDVATQCAASHPQALKTLFLPNGVFKDFAQTDRAKSLPVAAELFEPQHKELLQSLNYLVHIEAGASNHPIVRIAQKALDKYAKNLDLKNATIDFQIALNDIVFEKMKEHNARDVKQLHKKLLQNNPHLNEYATSVDVSHALKLIQEASMHKCAPEVQLADVHDTSICPARDEFIPTTVCGSKQSVKAADEQPKETCKTIGNDNLHAPEHTQAHKEENVEEWQCNHSKGPLPSLSEQATAENAPPAQAPHNVTPQEETTAAPKEKLNAADQEAEQTQAEQESRKVIIALKAGESLPAGFLKHLDPSVGDLTKLEAAVDIFKNVPGAMTKDGPITKLLEYGIKKESLKTAYGAAYELENAYDLVKNGETIISFGTKEELVHKVTKVVIKQLEIDIQTISKFVECKNWDWSKVSPNTVEKLRKKLPLLRDLAELKNKKFELHFKNKMPSSLNEFKHWLVKNNIHFYEGQK